MDKKSVLLVHARIDVDLETIHPRQFHFSDFFLEGAQVTLGEQHCRDSTTYLIDLISANEIHNLVIGLQAEEI